MDTFYHVMQIIEESLWGNWLQFCSRSVGSSALLSPYPEACLVSFMRREKQEKNIFLKFACCPHCTFWLREAKNGWLKVMPCSLGHCVHLVLVEADSFVHGHIMRQCDILEENQQSQ